MSRMKSLALCGALVLWSLPAAAQTDGSGMRQILGWIGIIEPERDAIEYRPRAPLVVPPAMKLPQPKAGAGARADWPKDPDVEARRAASADLLKPATEREKYIMGQRPLLSQDELRKGRIDAPAPPQPFPRSQFDESPYERQIQPILIGREIAAQRAAKEDLSKLSREEPARRYLSDPPVGTRKPSANAELKLPAAEPPPPPGSRYGQQEFTAEQSGKQ